MFRPTFESLERREVFSGTDPVPMETMSLNVAEATEMLAAVQGGTYAVNVGPDVSQLAGDFTGDGNVDGADFLIWRSKRGLVGDFNNDIPVEANDLAVGNSTAGNPTAGAN